MAKRPEQARAWQRMLSGRRLDLLDPSPLDVEIADIAHGLARVARWNGQTRGRHAFSVAQHSILVEGIVAQLAPDCVPAARMIALLHDAPEYVIGDMISPFKAAMGGDYKQVEHRLQRAVHLRFGLPPEPDDKLRARIKRADRIAAYLEATVLAGFSQREAVEFFGRPVGVAAERFDLTPQATEVAQASFLNRFGELERLRADRAGNRVDIGLTGASARPSALPLPQEAGEVATRSGDGLGNHAEASFFGLKFGTKL